VADTTAAAVAVADATAAVAVADQVMPTQ